MSFGAVPDADVALFGEGPGGFVVTGAADAIAGLADGGVPVITLGEVGGDVLSIGFDEDFVSLTLEQLSAAHAALGPLFP
ncbi:MAG: phosphoribosylformylglycinamidine synthase subunit PurL [Solirubrobacterales bacterium]|nr:phosphoribosylformylglycinamidine synthase subunit PurL [Solirubrobacterales bacterium]